MNKLKQAIAAGLLAALTMAAGCAGTYRGSYYSSGYAVSTPPPANVYEVQGASPYYDAVWIPGYWNYDGGRYVWRRGHYTHGRRGYGWVPHRWVRDGGGYRLYQGHWEAYSRRNPGYYYR